MNLPDARRGRKATLVVGIVSLLWNLGGAIDYVMTKSRSDAYLAMTAPGQRAWFDSYPWWMELAWAVGVWGAIAGSLLLIARRREAVTAFALSLAGLLVSIVYQYGVGDMPAALRTTGGIIFNAVLCAVAIALLWYARRQRARGTLR